MKKFFKTTLACMLALLIVGLILPIVGISIIAGVVASSGADSTIEKNSVLFLTLTESLRSVQWRILWHR